MNNNADLIQAMMSDDILKGVFSGSRKGIEQTYQKATIKPIMLKEHLHYHVSYYEAHKVFHENIEPEALGKWLEAHIYHYFKQVNIFTAHHDYQILISKKGKVTVKKQLPSLKKETLELSHNRKKQYLMSEGEPIDFLIRLGVMDDTGRVFKKRYDKFRQLNKYLEFVEDAMHLFEEDEMMTIIDFGCGKAYLTFALYYYLVKVKGKKVKIIGLDLKEDVITFCNEVADSLDYEGLKFELGNIEDYRYEQKVDMVVSLHACDTATDAAIGKSVGWGAKVIFAVPCCQHELFQQINNQSQQALLKHGVVKDKLVTLITDTLRAEALEIVGYDVQMLEFIDLSHTPKNVLIRAYLNDKSEAAISQAVQDYQNIKQFWHVEPSVEKMIGEKLKNRLEAE